MFVSFCFYGLYGGEGGIRTFGLRLYFHKLPRHAVTKLPIILRVL